VVEGRVLLLLDLIDGAVLEGPSEHIGLVVGALDDLRLGEGRPELGEVLKLDEVPTIWVLASEERIARSMNADGREEGG
jgi:hypothetical protein